ncbi:MULTISPECIES: mechanosensitive ion channel domain-containing protein [Limnospira]|uniref:mechanosensitive ion channel domain-containing protein n=1 Tax=Limnospira TaxID=2596745 RepID=UPI0001C38095|nr:mechanosensitive ion channel protein [Arthrospira platensis str. Paraca]MDT9311168.1 mechanosensitive ion channel [Limnospira sp. Paracas R14]
MSIIQDLIGFFWEAFTRPIKLGEIYLSIQLIVTVILAFFAIFLVCTFLSNLLKDKILVKLKFDEGSREAIATIFRYFTITIGCLLIPQAAGIDMSSFTFLAGGLGIGLGFGFQGLAQNFVSGLILLLERPIKVGDYIELDKLEGTIRKISIRSTVIVTNDDISIIVPNQILVSNKIINWSHGNVLSRIHIPVRVAYGSDPVLVTEVLLSAARQEPRVLRHPKPQVWLRNFGENCIDFELLVWIELPKARLPIQSSLNYIIQSKLYQNNINIPIAQRDLWIRNTEELKQVFAPIIASSQSAKIKAAETTEQQELERQNMSLKALLRKVVYFEGLSDLALLGLIEMGYRETFAPHQFIFHEDDPGDAFHIILSGVVEILAERANKHIRDLSAGDFFGELALIMGIPRTAAVRAKETTILFVVSRDVFQRFLGSYPQVADQIAEKLAERKEELVQRQKMLRELGILGDEDLDNNPLVWIKQRMKSLFGI